MSNAEEIINHQIGIIKQIFQKTGDGEICKELQIELYKQVNKWLISNKISDERKNDNEIKPTDKQIEYAKNLGIIKPETFSKKSLSEKIKEVLNET